MSPRETASSRKLSVWPGMKHDVLLGLNDLCISLRPESPPLLPNNRTERRRSVEWSAEDCRPVDTSTWYCTTVRRTTTTTLSLMLLVQPVSLLNRSNIQFRRTSRLYCNSLLYGTSQRSLDRLQRVQNSLFARVMVSLNSSATSFQCHWAAVAAAYWFARVSSSSSGPLRSELSMLGHQLAWRTNCTITNRRGHCALAPLPPCTGLIHASSHFHQYSIICSLCTGYMEQYLRFCHPRFCEIGTFETALKTHLFNSVYIYAPRHLQSSIGASDSL